MFHTIAALAVSIPLVLLNILPGSWAGEITGPQCLPPVAVDDSYQLWEGETLTVAAPGVLANDSDPEGRPITAYYISGPAHGALTLNLDGSFTYTPAEGFSGVDTFSYKANNGTYKSTTAAVVTLTVKDLLSCVLPIDIGQLMRTPLS